MQNPLLWSEIWPASQPKRGITKIIPAVLAILGPSTVVLVLLLAYYHWL
jgi:hypothetical protein